MKLNEVIIPRGRPEVQIDWNEYDKLHNQGLSNHKISKVLLDKRTGRHISPRQLYKGLKKKA